MKASWSFGTVVMHANGWEGRQKQKELCMRMNCIAEFRPTRCTYSQNNKFGVDRSHAFLTRTWALPRTAGINAQLLFYRYTDQHRLNTADSTEVSSVCVCCPLHGLERRKKRDPHNPIAQPKELQDRIQTPNRQELVFKFWESSATPKPNITFTQT